MKTVGDRVQETSETSGTGTFDLSGAVSGHRTFVDEIGDGNTCHYLIEHRNGTEWELGIGTVTDAATDTLSRDTVLKSSNSDAKVGFSGGTKDVICTMPSGRSVLTDIKPTFSVDVDLGSNSLLNASIAAPLIDSGTLPDARIQESGVTQHESAIDHDALTNFLANEHIDWTADQGATDLHDGNVSESSVTQHEAALSIAESQIPDGSLLARLADAETVAGAWTFSASPTMGAPVLFADGSAAAPGITFDGDSDTGFYRPTANRVNLTLGGGAEYVFDSSFFSILSAQLRLADGTQGAPAFTFANAGGLGLYRTGTTTANWTKNLVIEGDLVIGSDPGGSALLRVGGDGAVSGNLEVGDTGVTGGAVVAIAGTADPWVSFHHTDGSRIGYLQLRNSNPSRLVVQQSEDLEFYTNDTKRVTIKADGNLAVGSGVGNFLLHVAGGNYAHLGAPASGPTTGDMDNGSVVFSVDETNNELDVTVKYSDGTVMTGTVSLS